MEPANCETWAGSHGQRRHGTAPSPSGFKGLAAVCDMRVIGPVVFLLVQNDIVVFALFVTELCFGIARSIDQAGGGMVVLCIRFE